MKNKNIGLSDEEVINNRNKYGDNNISLTSKNTFLNLLLESLGDPIIKILIIALMIKVVFLFKSFDWFETLGIIIAIFVASFISSISEYGSEKAFSKLQESASQSSCKCYRNGNLEEVVIDDVVVGDVIVLQAGDKVPADGYIISGNVSLDESCLNGESQEVYKEEVSKASGRVIEKNRVYRGSVVCSNEAIMKVDKVGLYTVYGSVAKELVEKQPESPLKLKLKKLADVISKIGYVSSILVFVSYLFSVIVIKNDFNVSLIRDTVTNFPLMMDYIIYALTLCVTIIIVAVPEGLPMMITLVLSSNMKRMLKDNVLVRRMVGIETAGSLNILFTDKTGTLTKGQLEVIGFVDGELNEYSSDFEMKRFPKYFSWVQSSIFYNCASYRDENGKVVGGNITDRALLGFLHDNPTYSLTKIKNIPFDSKNKYSVTTVSDGEKRVNLIKGAQEVILSKCNSYYNSFGVKCKLIDTSSLCDKIKSFEKRGIRVLVLATSEEYIVTKMNRLTLVGIVLIKDDIRKEAIDGIKLFDRAHIQTVMITGDNKDTAISIAKECGIVKSDNDIVMTGEELKYKSDEEIGRVLDRLKVVARSLPSDKSRLVKIAQSRGLVVGMTGDGVNDAPALKKADVGFAMGSGTEVAKEASDIIILDDNLLSISKAILYGRTIFKSIRKFVVVQLTINLCAISLSIICPFIGINTPVTVIQMLWINMVMDTLAGLAFAFEPPLVEYMDEYPKKRSESILNNYMISEIFITGIYSSILCLLFLKLPVFNNLFKLDQGHLMTAFFGMFIFIDIFNSFSARTNRINIFANLTKNKVFIIVMLFVFLVQILLIYKGGTVFRTTGLYFDEFILMIVLALTVIPVDWLRKVAFRGIYGKNGIGV